MTLLNTIDVGGTDFGLLNNNVLGVCATPAGSEVKACTFADNFELKAGVPVIVKFTYANTYGDGSTTYPKLSVNGTSYPVKYTTGAYAGAGAWVNGQTVSFLYDGTNFIIISSQAQGSIISTANTTLSGAPLFNGATLKVMFTSALTAVDAQTPLSLTYNGTAINVKVPVNGALTDYVAKAVDNSFYFCQAYTSFELMYDGTYFVILENPVVFSNSDYSILVDGSIIYSNVPPCSFILTYRDFGQKNITVRKMWETFNNRGWNGRFIVAKFLYSYTDTPELAGVTYSAGSTIYCYVSSNSIWQIFNGFIVDGGGNVYSFYCENNDTIATDDGIVRAI